MASLISPLFFTGKHCAVVGGTGTIGVAIAKTFASLGAAVSILGRTALQPPSRLRRELGSPPQGEVQRSDTPTQHRFIKLDVLSTESINFVFGTQVDYSQSHLHLSLPDTVLSAVVDTNLTAIMRICKHARVRRQGCIINVSSLMAYKSALGAAAYAATKAGLIAFTRTFCREMTAREVRVNALVPGWVESPMWNDLSEDLKKQYIKNTPCRRVALPSEVADAAVFLAANKFANNCVLNLDGGLSAA